MEAVTNDAAIRIKAATAVSVILLGGKARVGDKVYFLLPEYECVIYRKDGEIEDRSSKLKITNALSLFEDLTEEEHAEHCKFIQNFVQEARQ